MRMMRVKVMKVINEEGDGDEDGEDEDWKNTDGIKNEDEENDGGEGEEDGRRMGRRW